jgi:hypothetical protein
MNEITLTGQRTVLCNGSLTRYILSNGWFIDGSRTRAHRHYSGTYSLWEPGADPSGCAANRGGAPTLKLALAVANGGTCCGMAEFGCRELATGWRPVTVRGTEGRVYHCAKCQTSGVTYYAVEGGDRNVDH